MTIYLNKSACQQSCKQQCQQAPPNRWLCPSIVQTDQQAQCNASCSQSCILDQTNTPYQYICEEPVASNCNDTCEVECQTTSSGVKCNKIEQSEMCNNNCETTCVLENRKYICPPSTPEEEPSVNPGDEPGVNPGEDPSCPQTTLDCTSCNCVSYNGCPNAKCDGYSSKKQCKRFCDEDCVKSTDIEGNDNYICKKSSDETDEDHNWLFIALIVFAVVLAVAFFIAGTVLAVKRCKKTKQQQKQEPKKESSRQKQISSWSDIVSVQENLDVPEVYYLPDGRQFVITAIIK